MRKAVKWISILGILVFVTAMIGCGDSGTAMPEDGANSIGSESSVDMAGIDGESESENMEVQENNSETELPAAGEEAVLPDMTFEEALAVVDDPKTRESLYFEEEVGMALYKARTPQENALDFTGEWNRTNVPTYYSGKVTITNQDEYGFDVNGIFFWFAHTGDIMNERAYFVTEDLALYEIPQEYLGDEDDEIYNKYWSPYEYIAFRRVGDEMLIYATGAGGALGYFSMNATPTGEFVKGEPVYTNADILAETYTTAQLEQIRTLVGDEAYEDVFVNTTEYGAVTVEECVMDDGTAATEYYGIVYGVAGYSQYVILSCENGDLYCLLWGPEYKLYSNVEGATEMPEPTYVWEIEKMEALENFKAEHNYFKDSEAMFLGNYVEQDYCFLTGGDLTGLAFTNAWVIKAEDGKLYMVLSYMENYENIDETYYRTAVYDITGEMPERTDYHTEYLLDEYDYENRVFTIKVYQEDAESDSRWKEEERILNENGELVEN